MHSTLLLTAARQERMIFMQKKKSISLRLSPEARQKCEDAITKGYSRTAFIDQAIRSIPYYDKAIEQKLLPHFCAIAESVAAIKGNPDLKAEMRKELDEICRYLNSRPGPM